MYAMRCIPIGNFVVDIVVVVAVVVGSFSMKLLEFQIYHVDQGE